MKTSTVKLLYLILSSHRGIEYECIILGNFVELH